MTDDTLPRSAAEVAAAFVEGMPDTLPPLPEQMAHLHSDGELCWDRNPGIGWPISLFTADQMRAYAAAAVAAERERCIRIVLDAPFIEPEIEGDAPEVDDALKAMSVSIAAKIKRATDPGAPLRHDGE